MCIVILCEKDFPTLDSLQSAELMNHNGGGIAWIGKDKLVHYEKGIDAKRIHALIESKAVKLPAIIHFRITSVGETSKVLCHPFPIDQVGDLKTIGTSKAVLFHNGHWDKWQEICMNACISRNIKFPSGQWSDSRAMAWLANGYGMNFLKLIEGQKIAVLTTKGIKKYGDGWTKIKGNIEASNNYHENTYVYEGVNYGGGHFGHMFDQQTKYKNSVLDDALKKEIKAKDFWNEEFTQEELDLALESGIMDIDEYWQLYYMLHPNNDENKPEWEKAIEDYTPINMMSAKQSMSIERWE